MTTYQPTARQRILGEGRFDWRWALAGTLGAFQLLFVGWLVVQPGGEEALVWFDDISFVIATVVATVMAGLVAARAWGSRSGYAWALICLGLAMITFGETAWGVQEVILGKEVPFPSVADIGYLGIYPPVFLGLLLMPQAPLSAMKRLKLSLDTLIAMLAIAVLSWYLILSDLLSASGETPFSKGVAVAYPFADLGIVFAVLLLISRSGRGLAGAAVACLGAGFAAIALSDSVYTYLTSVKGYATGSYIDAGWMLGYSLITIAALISLSRRVSFERGADDGDHSFSFWRLLLPYAAVVPLAVTNLPFTESHGSSHFFLEAGTLVVFGIIIVRQVLALYENVHLNRELAALTEQLQIKVQTQTMDLLRRRRAANDEPERTGERPNGADEPVGGLRQDQR